jgi:hypothetical protein
VHFAADLYVIFTYDALLLADDLKYDLHVLLVRHGKLCPHCAKAGSARQRGAAKSGEGCPLADLKVPPGKRKAMAAAGSKPKQRGGSKGGGTAGEEGGIIAAVAAGPDGAAAIAVSDRGSKRRRLQRDPRVKVES